MHSRSPTLRSGGVSAGPRPPHTRPRQKVSQATRGTADLRRYDQVASLPAHGNLTHGRDRKLVRRPVAHRIHHRSNDSRLYDLFLGASLRFCDENLAPVQDRKLVRRPAAYRLQHGSCFSLGICKASLADRNVGRRYDPPSCPYKTQTKGMIRAALGMPQDA